MGGASQRLLVPQSCTDQLKFAGGVGGGTERLLEWRGSKTLGCRWRVVPSRIHEKRNLARQLVSHKVIVVIGFASLFGFISSGNGRYGLTNQKNEKSITSV